MMFDHRLIIMVFTMCISHAAWAEDALVLVSGQIKNVKKSWGPHCPPTQDTEVDKPGLKYRVGVGSTLKPLSGQRSLFEPRICQKTTGLPSLREERSQTLITCHSAPEAARQVKGRTHRAPRQPKSLSPIHLITTGAYTAPIVSLRVAVNGS